MAERELHPAVLDHLRSLGLSDVLEDFPTGSAEAQVRADATTELGFDRPVLAGRYRVEERLGSGGMAVVHGGTDLVTGERVALKIARYGAPHLREQARRFVREARAALQMSGRDVARVIDMGEDEGVPFIVMELLRGHDVRQALTIEGRFAPNRVRLLGACVCKTLARAHAQGIIHRDIKPSNLFLPAEGGLERVIVLDFGAARVLEHWSTLTASLLGPEDRARGTIAAVGSPTYMAPEQFAGRTNLDGRTDLWALGIVLYELLTGMPPFVGDTLASLRRAVLSAPVPPPPCEDEALAGIIVRCLERDLEERYPTAIELGRDLTNTEPAVQ